MAGPTDPLITAEQLAAYPGRTVPADQADLLIAGVSAAVRERCGWHIAPSITQTVTVDGSGGRLQLLPTLRLTAVNSVTDDGTALAVDDYDWAADGRLWRSCGWTRRLRGVVAEIVHGYDETPAWMVSMVCAKVKAAATVPAGVKAERSDGESITYADGSGGVGFSDLEESLLDLLTIPEHP